MGVGDDIELGVGGLVASGGETVWRGSGGTASATGGQRAVPEGRAVSESKKESETKPKRTTDHVLGWS
jgi:hypothetical protein